MVKDWHEIEPWFAIDGFDDVILSRVNIIDILDMLDIEYGQCRSGEFTHRIRCPFKIHAEGAERTPSCYVSQETNSFYCFGCNSNGTLIDFYAKYKPCPYFKAMEEISGLIGITSEEDIQKILDTLPKREKRDPEKTMAFHVFKTGSMIREYLQKVESTTEYSRKVLWADKKIFPKLDSFLDDMSDDDWEKAKEFHDKIKGLIGKK